MTSKVQSIKEKIVIGTVGSQARKVPLTAKPYINTTSISPFPMVSVKTILEKSTLVYQEVFLSVIFRMLATHGWKYFCHMPTNLS